MSSKDFQINGFGRYLRWLRIGLLVMMIVGCAGSPVRPSGADSTAKKGPPHPKSKIATSASTTNDLANLEQRLRSEVRQWEGTPHRMGGASRRGIDCSGLVHRLYQDIFDRQIPRSTARLVKSGQPIGRHQLRTGDLVFFKVPSKGRHVGIYLGRAEFAHASTTKGVTISSLEDRFWRRAYWTARRYLNTPQ
jgi:probable lipoprotein NlpC